MPVPTYQPDETPVWSGEMNYNDEFTGTFYITNRRLLFERMVGTIRKRKALAVEVPLKDITSTSIEKGPWDWTVLVIDANKQRHRFLFRIESPDALMKRISELMALRKAADGAEETRRPADAVG